MKVSARNTLEGTVKSLSLGAVNAEVVVDVAGVDITAVITKSSVERLGLKVGGKAHVIIKSSDVILGVD